MPQTEVVFKVRSDVVQAVAGIKQVQDSTVKLGAESKSATDSASASWASLGSKLNAVSKDIGTTTTGAFNSSSLAVDKFAVSASKPEPFLNKLGQVVTNTARGFTSLDMETIKLLGDFDRMLRPADSLEERFIKLQKAGVTNADIARVYSNEIIGATDKQRSFGQSIPPTVAGLEKEARAFQETQSKAGGLGSAFESVKGLAAAFGVTLGAIQVARILREWVSAAIEFENKFADVTTLFDTAVVNVEAMRRELLGLSTELGNTTDLTEGLYEALSAGVAPAKAVQFVGESAKFAQAALTDTKTAVDVLTTVLNAYGLEAEQTGHISDVLFQIIKDGKIHGDELANSLGRLIPTASALGVPLEEVGAAIATLTQGGIKSREAVTSLNQVMVTFLKPSSEAKELAAQLGVELGSAAIQSKGLFGALKDLAEKTQGNAEATATFFGNVRALKGVLALTGSQANTYSQEMINMLNVTTNTNVAFEKQITTVGKQLGVFWDNLTKLFIRTVDGANGAGTSIRSLNMAIDKHGESIASIIRGYAASVVGFSDFKGNVDSATDSTKSFTERVISAGNALLALFNPLNIASVASGTLRSVWDKLTASLQVLGLVSLPKMADAVGVNANSQKGLTDQSKVLAIQLGYLANQNNAASKAARDFGEAQQKLKDKAEASIAPINALAREIKSFMDAGISKYDLVRLYKDQIAEAAKAQAEFGRTLSPLAQELTFFANAMKAAEDNTKSNKEALNSLIQDSMKRDGVEAIAALQLAVDKFNIDQIINEFGEVPQVFDNVVKAAQDIWLKKIPEINQEMIKNVRKIQMDQMPEIFEESGRKSSKVFDREISTIWNDLTKRIAKNIIEWKGWTETVLSVLKEFGRAALRIFLDALFNPLREQLEKFGKKLSGVLTGAGGGVGGGVGGILGGIFGLSIPASQSNNPLAAGFGRAGIATGIIGATGAIAGAVTGLGASAVMMSMLTNPWTAAIAGAIIGLSLLLSKNPIAAGVKEFNRDLGGLTTSKNIIDDFVKSVGLSSKQFEGIRKDILSSPKFLVEVAFPIAQAQGKVEEFLTSLEKVQTSFGTFNFRDAFQVGLLTGDFGELNKAFAEAFGKSERLVAIMPDFATKLAAVGGEASETWKQFSKLLVQFNETGVVTDELAAFIEKAGGSLEAFKAAAELPQLEKDIAGLSGMREEMVRLATQTETMYQKFLKTGEITDDFAERIRKAGGDIRVFKEFADVSKARDTFASLRAEFEKTGEITPALRDIFQQFGGDLEALDKAAKLPALRESMGLINSFLGGLSDLLPKEKSPLERFLAGEGLTEAFQKQLIEAGIDPQKLVLLSDLVTFRQRWNEEIKKFELGQPLSTFLEQALFKFGGPEGIAALMRARITGASEDTMKFLNLAKNNIDEAFVAEANSVRNLLKDAGAIIQTEMGGIASNVKAAMDAVQVSISKAFEAARIAAVAELDKIILGLETSVANIKMNLQDAISDIVNKLSKLGPEASTSAVDISTALAGIRTPDIGQSLIDSYNRARDYIASNQIVIGSSGAPIIGSRQFGGPIERTGTYLLHAGEQVVPSGHQPQIMFVMNGDVYGMDDFEGKVADAFVRGFRRGGFPFLRK